MRQFVVPARRLLKENIDTIREKRGIKTRKELAFACRKSESWISKIYKRENGSFRLDDLNTIAEVLGVEVYHLFQPGFSRQMERRHSADRRSGKERRVGLQGRHLTALQAELNKVPHLQGTKVHADDRRAISPAITKEIYAVLIEAAERIERLQAELGDQTPTRVPKVAAGAGNPRNLARHPSEKKR